VRPGLDDQGRQAGQVGEDGADQAEGGVLSRRVVGDPGGQALRAEQRVGLAFGFHGRPGPGEVGVRRHDEGRGRVRVPGGEPVVDGDGLPTVESADPPTAYPDSEAW
jgi:hypothetical protein